MQMDVQSQQTKGAKRYSHLPPAGSNAQAHKSSVDEHAAHTAQTAMEQVASPTRTGGNAADNAPQATVKCRQRGTCATRLTCEELDWENPAQIAALGTFDVILVADVVSS